LLLKPDVTKKYAAALRRLTTLPFWVSLLAILLVLFDIGFEQSVPYHGWLEGYYLFTLFIVIVATVTRHVTNSANPNIQILLVDFTTIVFFAVLIALHLKLIPGSGWLLFLKAKAWFTFALLLAFIREFVVLRIRLKKVYLNPAQLFITSFFTIIILGGFLLMLPRATHSGISLIDALFTSTSAVCVTGLIVVDTGSHFTSLGQTILLLLIQVGGLGIMTFASYFSYFFRGGSSYENQFMLRDLTSAQKIGEVFSILRQIIIVTLIIEGIGAALIFTFTDDASFSSFTDKVFFAVFHSISAFCNAGFSTLPNSLYELPFRFNYPLHLIVATLFIIGGLGFPIVFNLVRYVSQKVMGRLFSWLNIREYTYTPWLLNLNSRIVLVTSLILTVAGTLLIFMFEYNHTLSEHQGFGKVVTAFFGATTPRTAGFNSVNMSSLQFSTIMIIFLLMWIGASPASTGGGIKTSTFAIATMNFVSLARGKNRIEIFKREIADISVRRAFAIISLSLLILGFAIFLVTTFDTDKDLMSIAFECFSAYSTVGLSMGITADLSSSSKLIIMAVMFIGRVSMLSILIALVSKVSYQGYHYPGEEILIN
jgi:trk system potassium uptake protein